MRPTRRSTPRPRHDEGRRAGVGDRAAGGENVVDASAGGQSTLGGPLDDRTVHEGIAVGKADLDDVDPGIDHRGHRGDRGGDVGVADRQVPDERRSALGSAGLEGVADPHAWTPIPLAASGGSSAG
jgi:hypothetical protein